MPPLPVASVNTPHSDRIIDGPRFKSSCAWCYTYNAQTYGRLRALTHVDECNVPAIGKGAVLSLLSAKRSIHELRHTAALIEDCERLGFVCVRREHGACILARDRLATTRGKLAAVVHTPFERGSLRLTHYGIEVPSPLLSAHQSSGP
jgi:hypothetical protein